MSLTETALIFEIEGVHAVGILHHACLEQNVGIVMVVGGPQYRVGSHRQFVLLARHLAAAGFPVLRFDHRGIGDSDGPMQGFEHIGADIKAAVDVLIENTRVRHVVLWGLCDGASAALMYSAADRRIAGIVLLNPWVHSVRTEAKVRLKSYYGSRLRSRDFWLKLARLRINWRDSLRSLRHYLRESIRRERQTSASSDLDFVRRMRNGWETFTGPALLILSEDDLTAAEFKQLANESAEWRALLENKPVHIVDVAGANHTFSRAEWRAVVEHETADWLSENFPNVSNSSAT